MKLLIFILTFIFNPIFLYAQVEFLEHLQFNGNTYQALIVKIDSETISKFSIIENPQFKTHQEVLRMQQAIHPSFFLVNASISDSNCRPMGYFIKDSQKIQDINLADGVGNFYLKPNGALLLTSEAIICNSEEIANYSNVTLGIQSGPMLVSGNVINPQFNVKSNNKNIRIGVGVFSNNSNDQFLIFAISENEVTFYEFATLFQSKFKCINALCLESAGCTFYVSNSSSTSELFDGVICNYIFLKL
jgi:uncharacterized protein YigE (DUF2233 family)